MVAYFTALGVAADGIMQGLALSLTMRSDHCADFTTEPAATLRRLHCPPARPEVPAQVGAGAHTDLGGLAIFLQDDVAGLQVRDPAGDAWIEAPPFPAADIVNLGDMTAR